MNEKLSDKTVHIKNGHSNKRCTVKRLIGQKSSLHYGMLMWMLRGKQAMLMDRRNSAVRAVVLSCRDVLDHGVQAKRRH